MIPIKFVHEAKNPVVPTNAPTRKEREIAGAALYQKASGGAFQLDLRHMPEEGLDILTGLLLASWRFDRYRTVKEPPKIAELLVLTDDPEGMERRFSRQRAVIEGIFLARDLTAEPANVLYPLAYAERLKKLKSLGVAVDILDAEALKMTALMAVSRGSAHDPAVAVMTWKGPGAADSQPIVIVGKGVCFDAGGLCLKSAVHQLEMKWDKAGAGVVAGLMKTLALQNAPVYVIGIAPLVENMPDGKAMKPGDIIATKSLQTVEVVNTDAEGRLVLADCLWYAQEAFNPKVLIDLGTLTPETVASLGTSYAAIYSNTPGLSKALRTAGKTALEPVWELPMGPDFAKQIESDIADMKNLGLEGCGENGAAAEFLRRFIKDVPWAHIDIAGVSWTKEHLPHCCKGPTGFGVRLLEEWLKNS